MDMDKDKIKLYFWLIVGILFVICLFLRIIIFTIGYIDDSEIKFFCLQIMITDNPIESVLYYILNSLLLGLYLNTIGFNMSLTTIRTKIILLIVIIIIIAIGIQGISFRITVILPFLTHYSYQPNAIDGILFFSDNVAFLISLYLMSFLLESDKE